MKIVQPILRVVQSDVPVPLSSVEVALTIKGFVANIESTLHFKNTEKNAVEAVYEFPLDDQSAVYQFEARIADRVIIAECQEKQQAQETYHDAIDMGHTAMLLEEDDSASDTFRCLLGNLPPDTEATVKFAYVIELPLTPAGAVQFVLPTQLNPRYNPSVEDGGSAKPLVVPQVPTSTCQPYLFTFHGKVLHSTKILHVKSDTDDLKVAMCDDGKQAEISLSKPFVPDHDLSLQVAYEEGVVPHVVIEKGSPQNAGILGQDMVMLNFFPELSAADFSSSHEFLFVIDRSGSMAGSRIESASNALLVFLKSLPPGCYFNIIGFGNRHQLLFSSGSREYNEETLKLATDHQATLQADLGGTEILQPLRDIYSRPPMKTHSRQILLLTDGEVSNTEQVIELVRKNAGNTRVFTFGIGDGASTSLIKGVARAGRGKAEFVRNTEKITELVMKTLKCAMQSSVTDLQLEWQLGGSRKMIQIPSQIPPVFAGERLIVYALAAGDKKDALEGRVHLRGKIDQKVLDFTLNVSSTSDMATFDSDAPIHRLAAKAQIHELQDQERQGDEVKSKIVQLSVATNMVSKHTSMVGVDLEHKTAVDCHMVQRHVPLVSPMHYMRVGMGSPRYDMSLASSNCAMSISACSYASPPDIVAKKKSGGGLGSLFTKFRKQAPRAQSANFNRAPRVTSCAVECERRDVPPAAAQMRTRQSTSSDDDIQRESSYKCHDSLPTPLSMGSQRSTSGGAVERKPGDDFMRLVSLQTFNGSWKLDDGLVCLLHGFSQQQLIDAAPVKSSDVWATVIALAWLMHKFSAKKTEWEMIDVKARRWLSSQPLDGHSVEELVNSATTLLSSAATP